MQAIFLGVVQGLTEFLPVSSSGHLVILQDLLGVQMPGLSFEVMVHGGTLVAVFLAFGEQVWYVVRGVLAVVFGKSRHPSHREAARIAVALLVGSVPAAVAGVGLRRLFEAWFQSPSLAGLGLICTGLVLIAGGRLGRTGRGLREVGFGRALVIGVAQAVALVPGISRSGSTITAGLWMGLQRQAAAEFSFLLSIPAVAGALFLDIKELVQSPAGVEGVALWLGAMSAAVSGYFAIRVLLRFLRTGRYYLFAYYVWAVGILVMARQLQA
ncbi:MAG: undecaprenyl-diphosphate phosphatase [Bacillota bacterium]